MSEVSRFTRFAESFFIDRRWWQFLPAPLTVATLLVYRGPFSIAGGYATTYSVAAVVLVASVLLITLPLRAVRWGLPVMVVMCLGGALLTVAIPQSWTVVLPYLLASVGARRYPPRVAAVIVLAGAAGIVITQVGQHGHPLLILASLAVLSALAMTAVARRTRADRLEQVELALAREQAAHEEHARAAALAERARIAREVHDVLAHSLSALSLNLQGARLMLAKEGASEQAQEQIARPSGWPPRASRRPGARWPRCATIRYPPCVRSPTWSPAHAWKAALRPTSPSRERLVTCQDPLRTRCSGQRRKH
jgi:signal transduction histidine kinase